MAEVDFGAIEKKWQARWDAEKVFEVGENSEKSKFYVLEMFPYPSGAGLHMGHALNYTIGDILARFKIMKGFNVLHPMGYDSLGLPAENAAIKAGTHPEDYTNKAIENFILQTKAIGVTYDWSRKVNTASPDYYKWDQWIFLKMLEKGLAYQKDASVNWCPKCNTVLANEQVENGKCWRHEDTEVEVRKLKQWFFKTTKYAKELLKELDNIEWPEKTKIMQRNWIGRSEGTEICFKINNQDWKVFTTRPDTIFGVTFMVVAAGHERLDELVSEEQRGAVDEYLKRMNSVSEKDIERNEKEGVFSGSYAINPANGEKVPIWVGNFVLADYGSGMVMGVPAHDKRDFDFAKKYGIEVRQVVVKDLESYNNNNRLLRKLKEIRDITDEKNLSFWITGSLAMLFYLNDFNRKCEDIDLSVRSKEEQKNIVNLLIEKGFKKKNEFTLDNGAEVVVLEKKDFPDLDIIYPNDSRIKPSDFSDNFLKIANYKFKVISESYLKKIKESCIATNYKIEKNKKDLALLNKKDAYSGDGKLCNSGEFDGMNNIEAKGKITDWLGDKARRVVNFKLRDWGVSRQRYWGTPIPIVYCEKCGTVPVPEKDLPVVLPKDVKFGEGNPLKTNEEWLNCACPKCGGSSLRESDTMDTFVNSSWYFLRYADPKNSEKIFDFDKAKYWNPVDVYIGGAEHACMHLLYARFYTKFLRDIGAIDFDEPFTKLFHQGMIHAGDGRKMSKSLGNVIDPLDAIAKYGADAMRWFLVSVASPDKNFDWSETEISGASKFLKKIFSFFADSKNFGEDSAQLLSKLNLTIKNVEEYYGNFGYRKATIELRELFSEMEKGCSRESGKKFLKMIAPIAPHLAEELWERLSEKLEIRSQKLGENFISTSSWPEVDSSKILKKGNNDSDLNKVIAGRIKEIVRKDSKRVYVYVMPFEVGKIDGGKILQELKDSKLEIEEVRVFAVNDLEKIDPEGRAKRAKPGKASIYLE